MKKEKLMQALNKLPAHADILFSDPDGQVVDVAANAIGRTADGALVAVFAGSREVAQIVLDDLQSCESEPLSPREASLDYVAPLEPEEEGEYPFDSYSGDPE